MMFMRNLVKSYLDNYVLPGTNAGTEVLWIYMIQWKRDMANVTFAIVYILFSQLDLSKVESVISNTHPEENGNI